MLLDITLKSKPSKNDLPMFSVNTSSKNIFTKNLPSNFGVFSTLYLYILTVVPLLILVELAPDGSLDIKFTSDPNGFSNCILNCALATPTEASVEF